MGVWIATLCVAAAGCGVGRLMKAPPAPKTNSAAEILGLLPEHATAVVFKNHVALREAGIPFLLNPGPGFDGTFGGSFSESEIQLSAIAVRSRPRQSLQTQVDLHAACLQLAPGVTAQRLTSDWGLVRDEQQHSGFTCYRSTDSGERSPMVVERNSIVAAGPAELLAPRLAANPTPSSITKTLQPLTADYDLVICCLNDLNSLQLAEGYVDPLAQMIRPRLQELKTLQPGAISSLALALRVQGQAQMLIQIEAADESLASQLEGLIAQTVQQAQEIHGATREELRAKLRADSAGEIEAWLAAAIGGTMLERSGSQLKVVVPLGQGGAPLARVARLANDQAVALQQHLVGVMTGRGASSPLPRVGQPAAGDGATGEPAVAALDFLPADAAIVVWHDHRALREFAAPDVAKPGPLPGSGVVKVFSEEEIDRSLVARGGRGAEFDHETWDLTCVQLVPGVTVQRLVNAWQLAADQPQPAGLSCYRAGGPDGQQLLVIQRKTTVAIGMAEQLEPRLANSPMRGAIEKLLRPLAADYEVIHASTRLEGLEVGLPSLERISWLWEDGLEQLRSLPKGALNAAALAIKLRGKPQLLVRCAAADVSLATTIEELFQRSASAAEQNYTQLREDLKRELAAETRAEIDAFLARAASGQQMRRSGHEVEFVIPLGGSEAELRRFLELVERQRGLDFENALSAARKAVEHRDPREQLKQIGLAFSSHHDVFQFLPEAAIFDSAKKPLLSWRVQLLPFLGYEKLYEQFKLDEPWDSDRNRPLLDKMPAIYRNESVPDRTRTTLQFFTGDGSMFAGGKFGFRDISDGGWNTILAIQTPPDRAVPWTKPEDVRFVPADPLSPLGSTPDGGLWVVTFDGEVYNLPQNFPAEKWRRLISPRDGEAVQLPPPYRRRPF
jgi:hypothetical protein